MGKKKTAAPRTLAALKAKIKSHTDAISRERDALESLLEELTAALDPTDRAVEALRDAIYLIGEVL